MQDNDVSINEVHKYSTIFTSHNLNGSLTIGVNEACVKSFYLIGLCFNVVLWHSKVCHAAPIGSFTPTSRTKCSQIHSNFIHTNAYKLQYIQIQYKFSHLRSQEQKAASQARMANPPICSLIFWITPIFHFQGSPKISNLYNASYKKLAFSKFSLLHKYIHTGKYYTNLHHPRCINFKTFSNLPTSAVRTSCLLTLSTFS